MATEPSPIAAPAAGAPDAPPPPPPADAIAAPASPPTDATTPAARPSPPVAPSPVAPSPFADFDPLAGYAPRANHGSDAVVVDPSDETPAVTAAREAQAARAAVVEQELARGNALAAAYAARGPMPLAAKLIAKGALVERRHVLALLNTVSIDNAARFDIRDEQTGHRVTRDPFIDEVLHALARAEHVPPNDRQVVKQDAADGGRLTMVALTNADLDIAVVMDPTAKPAAK
jgi:hypothetical protein